jgi:signal transduction histidine kinase
MPAKLPPEKGQLLVRAENVDQTSSASPDLPVGQYVRIQIEDIGTGILESIRDRIFEVCFTTKPGGSGLGLATVKSIMHQLAVGFLSSRWWAEERSFR